MKKAENRTVAVVGAGPIGLAAAAHLLERGFTPLIFEAGPSVAGSYESFRHVQLFSPWRYNVDAAARRLLEASGWSMPDADAFPTAGAMIDRYLAPLAALTPIAQSLRLSHRVTSISREGYDKMKSKGRDAAPFAIRCATPGTDHGFLPGGKSEPVPDFSEFRAWAVLDASGTWMKANPLGANGLPAVGEHEHADHIAYGMPDILGRERQRYAGRRVLVAGAGHSAAGSLLALAKLAEKVPATSIVWTIRGHNFARIFGGGENDGLVARGALGRRLQALAESARLEVHADFRAVAILRSPQGLAIAGRGAHDEERRIEGIDEIIVATGGRPDLSLTSELRVKLDSWIESTEQLAPLIDPNIHSCGTVRPHGHRELAHPEARFYAVGAKSYGRAPNFLVATGYEQVRSVVAALAGDLAAADEVRLELPQTGICSTQFDEASSGCCTPGDAVAIPTDAATEPSCTAASCSGLATKRADACCGTDERIKESGGSGCGSAASKAASERAKAKACCS